MKISVRILQVLLLIVFAEVVAASDDPLDKTAIVDNKLDFDVDPCASEMDKIIHGNDLPIDKGDKFKVDKRDAIKRFINVELDPNNVMSGPNLYVINEGGPILAKNYCTQGGDVKSHLYVFGIGELENPADHKRSWHAFVYVPMKLKTASTSRVDEFYLMVFQIPTDTIQCGGVAKQRCKALRRLVVSQEIDSEGDYIKKIKKEMKKILPKRPPKVKRYHNGVIHGNF